MSTKKDRSIHDRILHVMKTLKYSEAQFARRLGASKSAIINVVKGNEDPSYSLINSLTAILPVSKEWIFLGKGQPFTTKKLDEFMADAEVEHKHRDVDVDLNKRIKLIRSNAGLNQTLFANELDVTRDVVTGIENFRSSPSIALVKRIASKMNINLMWIITGEGAMMKR